MRPKDFSMVSPYVFLHVSLKYIHMCILTNHWIFSCLSVCVCTFTNILTCGFPSRSIVAIIEKHIRERLKCKHRRSVCFFRQIEKKKLHPNITSKCSAAFISKPVNQFWKMWEKRCPKNTISISKKHINTRLRLKTDLLLWQYNLLNIVSFQIMGW